jgi:integrase
LAFPAPEPQSELDGLPVFITVPHAARLLGIKRASAYRLAASGELPTKRLGGRVYGRDRPPQGSGAAGVSRARGRRPQIPGLSVFARGKSWVYNLELDPDALTGERRREWKGGFRSETAAFEAGMQAKAARDENRRVAPSQRTVAEYLDEWLEAVSPSLKPSASTNYLDYTKAYVVPIIGKRRLQDVDVPMLNALYRRLLDSGRVKLDQDSAMYAYWKRRKDSGHEPSALEVSRACSTSIHATRKAIGRYRRGRVPVAKAPGLAPKTVRNVHRMLHRALSDAVAWRYLAHNPAAHASLPRTQRGSKVRPTPWTVEELTTWLGVALQDRDAGMWVLVTTTGMRRSELAGLARSAVDLDAGRVTIEPTRIVVAGHAQDSDGKTDASRRRITIDVFTVSSLREHFRRMEEEARALGSFVGPESLMFCHPDGRPLHPDTITRRFNRLVDNAAVRPIRLHDVRHTYATLSLDAGINPKKVSDRIGHADVGFTLSTYIHRSTSQDSEAADLFADLLADRLRNFTRDTEES